jgi:deoxyribonuclease-4
MPRLGAHVSAAGGLDKAPANAADLGLNTFQFFTRPPQTGRAAALKDAEIQKFLDACEEHGQETWHVHAPYIVNLASDKPELRQRSTGILHDELRRCSKLQATSLIAHVGSATGSTREEGIAKVIKGLDKILKDYDGPTYFCIEATAGAGNVLGRTFEEIKAMMKGVKNKKWLGVCLDTCHIHAAGYDLDTKKGATAVIDEFDQVIGLKHLKSIHLNDSQNPRSSHKDRHAHLGHGTIGLPGFVSFLSDKRLANIDFLLETPLDEKRLEDIEIARQWFKGKKAGPKAEAERQGKLV